ncbi:hypothetical protein GCM10009678_64720 [Actinomadura kijaniata]|uniref:Aminoglycoside phosphotransferase (APT) family kinase protein n=1 Tax=Actinomadura namibiensis TaxID=182080 RepID=A0A7W3LZP0_ACTNM|nr:phosphotransferase [Actinomadura namibiensis]MBA8957305.1 aminoglycoside phosphotransferase (APT) family kinase protein [Actinomadura namibiensis]
MLPTTDHLGPLTEAQVQRALDRFGLGRLVSAEKAPHGGFGQNLFLTTERGGYVLRGRPHYRGQFEAERFYAEALRRHTRVPVPWPYLVDERADVFGWPYVLMPRLEGLHLSDGDTRSALDPAQRADVARALGETLAEMHTLTRDRPGRYHPVVRQVVPLEAPDASVWALPDPAPGPDAGGPYASWVTSRTLARLRTARRHRPSATTPDDLAWAGDLLSRSAPALSRPFRPCLVMEDFKEGNLVVVHRDGRWRVNGVFDLAQSYFGDGETDVARTLCAYLDEHPPTAAAFLDAHRAAAPPRPGFAERAGAYLLLDRALLWEFFQRRALRWWPETWTFRDWAGRYLSLMDEVL